MKRLWGRLGMEIILDDEEYAAVLSENENSQQILISAIEAKRAVLNGETYFPNQYAVNDTGYDNPDDDLSFTLYDEDGMEKIKASFLERPYRKHEIVARENPKEKIVGIITMSIYDIIWHHPMDFRTLINEKMTEDVLLLNFTPSEGASPLSPSTIVTYDSGLPFTPINHSALSTTNSTLPFAFSPVTVTVYVPLSSTSTSYSTEKKMPSLSAIGSLSSFWILYDNWPSVTTIFVWIVSPASTTKS